MRLERSKNTKRNIIVGELDKISGILLPFLVRTMIIRLIGAEYLGLTGLYYSILQMLNLTEMGFGSAIVYSLYKPIAENDREAIQALLTFYVKAYRVIGLVVAAAGLALLPFLPYFIKGPSPAGMNIYALYVIYLLNSCIGFFVFPDCKAILTAYQRDDIAGRIHIVTQFVMYAGQAACIWFLRDYYLYAWMMPVTSLLYSLLCAKRVRKWYPSYERGGKLPAGQYREIRKQIAGLTIRKLAVMSRNALDSLFISAFLGLGMTAVYANYYYILDSVVVVLAVVRMSMAGGVGNSIAMESREKNLHDMQIINFLFMWISGWCSICLLCLYQPFMELWVGEEMMLPFGMVILFAAYFYVLKMGDIRTLYFESAGIWWQSRYLSIAEAAANVSLNWILVGSMGLYGIILATMISCFAFNFVGGAVLLFRYYFTQGGLGAYMRSQLRYAVVTGAAAFVVWTVTERIPAGGLAGFVSRGAVCTVLSNLIFCLAYAGTEDFREGRSLLARMLKIKWWAHG